MSRTHWVSYPVRSLSGAIEVPGDKSISHRALFLGSIAEGTTTIRGLSFGEDCMRTRQALTALGVSIELISPSLVRIEGVGKQGLRQPIVPIDCGNSGTTLRLLMGLLAGLPVDAVLVGDESLHRRPMGRVAHPLIAMGASIQTVDDKPPVMMRGAVGLHGIHYEMPVASAQVKTALLLAGLYATGTTSVTEPSLTRDHTERMLKAFAYPLYKQGSTVSIDAGHALKGAEVNVPGDLSSAAFFMVAATLIPGSSVKILNVGVNPTRLGIVQVLQSMGANIEISDVRMMGEEPVGTISVRYAPLQGVTIPADMVSLAIDEFPIIFIAAACATGVTHLQGAAELRLKESDRIASMVDGLQRLGIHAKSMADGVWIEGGRILGGRVLSHGDHRVAMAFATAGAVAENPVTVLDCAAVSTSFPAFIDTAKQIKLSIEIHHDKS